VPCHSLYWLTRRAGCGYNVALAGLSHRVLIPLAYQLPVQASVDEVVSALAAGMVLGAVITVNLAVVPAKLSKQRWRTMLVVSVLLVVAVLIPYGQMMTVLLAWVVMPVTAILTTGHTNDMRA